MLAFICGAGFLSTPVLGQSPVMADIAPCMRIAEDAARYACYDQLEDSVKATMSPTLPVAEKTVVTAPAPPAASVAASQPAAPANTPEVNRRPEPVSDAVESFGQQTPAQAAKVQTNSDGDAELHDTIISMQEREPGRWLFTLASGQIWYQVNSQRINLRKGDEVRIFPSPIGNSWRMGKAVGKEVGFVQVKRVQ